MPVVKAIKNFRNSADGQMVARGQELEVDEQRYKELARNGLVSELAGGAKMASAPANKMADEPANKAITHDTIRNKTTMEDERHPLVGGRTGGDASPSSSRPARPRRRRVSSERAGEDE